MSHSVLSLRSAAAFRAGLAGGSPCSGLAGGSRALLRSHLSKELNCGSLMARASMPQFPYPLQWVPLYRMERDLPRVLFPSAAQGPGRGSQLLSSFSGGSGATSRLFQDRLCPARRASVSLPGSAGSGRSGSAG